MAITKNQKTILCFQLSIKQLMPACYWLVVNSHLIPVFKLVPSSCWPKKYFPQYLVLSLLGIGCFHGQHEACLMQDSDWYVKCQGLVKHWVSVGFLCNGFLLFEYSSLVFERHFNVRSCERGKKNILVILVM